MSKTYCRICMATSEGIYINCPICGSYLMPPEYSGEADTTPTDPIKRIRDVLDDNRITLNATRAALIMQIMNWELENQGWREYTGDYDKRWYDIQLKDGTFYADCYPNADTFHPNGHNKYIQGNVVARIRPTDDPIWRSIHKRHKEA